jgi:tetratricopeptide (TPR) repeat protein
MGVMRAMFPARSCFLWLVPLLTPAPLLAQQLSPDDAAMLVLNAGRRAFNEAKYPVAADRFREFLKVAPNHKEAPAARYGLGLALLDTGDTKGAIETLQQVAATDSPDKPLALYHLGAVHRAAATQTLAQIAAKPAEADALRASANASFGEALKGFTSAGDVLTARVKKPLAGDVADLPPDAEWLVRARCDQAEMLVRLGKYKEAADLTWAVLADPAWSKSQHRPLASYYLGYASFLLKDYAGAGRALSELWPFGQEFGVHARYLLARTHHLSGELPEAGVQYKAVLTGFEDEK